MRACMCVCVNCEANLYVAFSTECVQINNPDMRVVIMKEFVKTHFPSTPLLDFAIEVEKITTSKVRVSLEQSSVYTSVYMYIYIYIILYVIILYFVFLFQKPNLILNVDGVIAVSFVDLLRHCGCFSS